jgi:hypothetical protein
MEALIQRIRNMLAYADLMEIHDRVVGPDVSEEDFFLAYRAAQRLAKEGR